MTDILLLPEANLDNGKELTEGELEKVGFSCQIWPNYKLFQAALGDVLSSQHNNSHIVYV